MRNQQLALQRQQSGVLLRAIRRGLSSGTLAPARQAALAFMVNTGAGRLSMVYQAWLLREGASSRPLSSLRLRQHQLWSTFPSRLWRQLLQLQSAAPRSAIGQA